MCKRRMGEILQGTLGKGDEIFLSLRKNVSHRLDNACAVEEQLGHQGVDPWKTCAAS